MQKLISSDYRGICYYILSSTAEIQPTYQNIRNVYIWLHPKLELYHKYLNFHAILPVVFHLIYVHFCPMCSCQISISSLSYFSFHGFFYCGSAIVSLLFSSFSIV